MLDILDGLGVLALQSELRANQPAKGRGAAVSVCLGHRSAGDKTQGRRAYGAMNTIIRRTRGMHDEEALFRRESWSQTWFAPLGAKWGRRLWPGCKILVLNAGEDERRTLGDQAQ